MNALIFSIIQLLHTVINLYIWIIIISSLLSFVRPDPHNPIVQILYRLTEPIYTVIRQKMPFLLISGIDLTPLILILGLQFLDTFMMNAFLG
jgi:YggT family protein